MSGITAAMCRWMGAGCGWLDVGLHRATTWDIGISTPRGGVATGGIPGIGAPSNPVLAAIGEDGIGEGGIGEGGIISGDNGITGIIARATTTSDATEEGGVRTGVGRHAACGAMCGATAGPGLGPAGGRAVTVRLLRATSVGAGGDSVGLACRRLSPDHIPPAPWAAPCRGRGLETGVPGPRIAAAECRARRLSVADDRRKVPEGIFDMLHA